MKKLSYILSKKIKKDMREYIIEAKAIPNKAINDISVNIPKDSNIKQ